jgi:hypothetical protein
MFDLERAVGDWRRGFAKERSFSRYDLDELEDHLRAAYEVELVLDPDVAPDKAFSDACDTLGSPGTVSEEFAKVQGRGWRRTLTAGWLLFAASFFLPVARYGITFGQWNHENGFLPGIEALLLAVGGWGGAIGVLSGLTNLFMLGTFWRISDAGRGRVRLLAWLMTLGMVLNLCWFVLTDDPSDLYAGYYAWLASFGVVGSGLWKRAHALPQEASGPDPVVAR